MHDDDEEHTHDEPVGPEEPYIDYKEDNVQNKKVAIYCDEHDEECHFNDYLFIRNLKDESYRLKIGLDLDHLEPEYKS